MQADSLAAGNSASTDAAIELINAGSTVVVAIATLVLAGITLLSLYREREKDRERRQAIEARIRAKAFELNGVLWRWEQRNWPVEGNYAAKSQFASDLQPQFARAMRLARELVEDAPEASKETAESVRAAYAKLSVTVEDLRELASPKVSARYGRQEELEGGFSRCEEYIGACRSLLEDEARKIADYL